MFPKFSSDIYRILERFWKLSETKPILSLFVIVDCGPEIDARLLRSFPPAMRERNVIVDTNFRCVTENYFFSIGEPNI